MPGAKFSNEYLPSAFVVTSILLSAPSFVKAISKSGIGSSSLPQNTRPVSPLAAGVAVDGWGVALGLRVGVAVGGMGVDVAVGGTGVGVTVGGTTVGGTGVADVVGGTGVGVSAGAQLAIITTTIAMTIL